MTTRQSISSQKGEIAFRRKLYQQQVGGREIFSDEFAGADIEEILVARMKDTQTQINALKASGLNISPYLEIGAERGQRSLTMENDLGAAGIAADLSFDMLHSAGHYAKIFHKEKIPLRVCCDVNNLPFLSASIPFVFCYDTLHHFPEPAPVIAEIKRVLAPGAYFFFGQEPYKKVLHLNLYKRGKLYSQKVLNSGKLRKIFDYFFANNTGNEIEHGIIENEEIKIRDWKQALSPFTEKKISLQSLGTIETPLFGPKNYFKYALNYLLGGNIFGLVRKVGAGSKSSLNREELLICPVCLETGQEINLHRQDSAWLCAHCERSFPIHEGVLFLLTDDKFRTLYPEIYENKFF